MKKTGSPRVLLLALCALALGTGAAGAGENAGSHAGFEQRMGPGGASAAMGNVGVADPQAAPAAFWNPAAASLVRLRTVSAAGEWRALDRHGGSVGVGWPIGRRALVAWSALWRGDAEVKWVDENDEDRGSFAPYWVTHYLSVGWRLSKKSGVGVTGQWRTWNVDVEGETWSGPISLGISWYRQWLPRFSTGIAIRDIGLDGGGVARFKQENYGGDGSSSEDYYPRTLVVGSRYSSKILGWPLHMELDLVDYHLNADGLSLFDRHEVQARCGAEWEVFADGRLRAGWDDGNWSLGVGWRFDSGKSGDGEPEEDEEGGEERPKRKKAFPWTLEVDYQLLWERNDTNFNPWGVGLKWSF
ncbi:MAG: hypothetical protein J6T45_00745 [Fibrobacterales bacterium]|nr:hypothetical protein [Fibrobacterales bacterium]